MHLNLFPKRRFIHDILINFILVKYLYILHRNIQENFLTTSHLSAVPVEDYLRFKVLAVRAFIFFFWDVSYRIDQEFSCFSNINFLIVLVIQWFYSSQNCTYDTVNIIFPTKYSLF